MRRTMRERMRESRETGQKVSSYSLPRVAFLLLASIHVSPSPIHHPPALRPLLPPPPSPCPPCGSFLHHPFAIPRALPVYLTTISFATSLLAPLPPDTSTHAPPLSSFFVLALSLYTHHVLLPRVHATSLGLQARGDTSPVSRAPIHATTCLLKVGAEGYSLLARSLSSSRFHARAVSLPSRDVVPTPTRSCALRVARVPPAVRSRTAFSTAAGMRVLYPCRELVPLDLWHLQLRTAARRWICAYCTWRRRILALRHAARDVLPSPSSAGGLIVIPLCGPRALDVSFRSFRSLHGEGTSSCAPQRGLQRGDGMRVKLEDPRASGSPLAA
ncbi:hypothetical protein FB451DRAFT_1434789 [Mycena latifolia]|nr:hypothetical protein FB451DRAFT_1434789 [Mycena latifolia]